MAAHTAAGAVAIRMAAGVVAARTTGITVEGFSKPA
jgi:hypothetical protein